MLFPFPAIPRRARCRQCVRRGFFIFRGAAVLCGERACAIMELSARQRTSTTAQDAGCSAPRRGGKREAGENPARTRHCDGSAGASRRHGRATRVTGESREGRAIRRAPSQETCPASVPEAIPDHEQLIVPYGACKCATLSSLARVAQEVFCCARSRMRCGVRDITTRR